MQLQPDGHTNILRLDIAGAPAYIEITCQAGLINLSWFSDIDVRVGVGDSDMLCMSLVVKASTSASRRRRG